MNRRKGRQLRKFAEKVISYKSNAKFDRERESECKIFG